MRPSLVENVIGIIKDENSKGKKDVERQLTDCGS